MWLPFLYLAIGVGIGLWKNQRILHIAGQMSNGALVILMLIIGAKIGLDKELLANMGEIGVNCILLALGVIGGSVACAIALEKTILPLEKYQKMLRDEVKSDLTNLKELQRAGVQEEGEKPSWFMLGIPLYLLLGMGTGYYLIPSGSENFLDYGMQGALFVIYGGVGISLGADVSVFSYLRLLGWKILLIPLGILIGSLGGALVVSLYREIPLMVGLTAASGMSYYSVTGAYMTQVLGGEAGIYGFVVNVLREFLTILLLPLLIRWGKSAPIAGGASGNMDVMLLPVTRFVGPEIGLIALLTGTILTMMVPFLLPSMIFLLT